MKLRWSSSRPKVGRTFNSQAGIIKNTSEKSWEFHPVFAFTSKAEAKLFAQAFADLVEEKALSTDAEYALKKMKESS